MLSVSRYFRGRGLLRGLLRGRRRSKLEGRRCQRNHSFIMCLNT